MTIRTHYLAAAAAIGALAVPAAAQTYPGYPQAYPQYPQQYPQQTYPQYPQGYGQPGYAYGQGTTGNPVTDIIDQLLGNRYNVTDRQAVRQCARAAQVQAQNQYGGAYGQRYGYNGYNQNIAAPAMRVTAITSVERRSNGLRVRGTLGTGYAGQYGNRYGYQGQGYGNAYAAGDISFRCNVDYRGAVTDIRIGGYGNRRY
jgi:hypothetical protein